MSLGTWVYGGSSYPPPSYAPQPSPVHRLPILVGILAILIGIVGVFVLLIGLLALLWGLGIIHFLAVGISNNVVSSLVVAGGIYFVLGMILLVVARGLWDTESWALYLTGFVAVVLTIWAALPPTDYLGLILGILLIVYLVAVRQHFA